MGNKSNCFTKNEDCIICNEEKRLHLRKYKNEEYLTEIN